MNRLSMNADSIIAEIIKDARDYLIKSRLHVGTAVSVGYKSVRAALYALKDEGTEPLRMAVMGIDSELDTVIPTKEKDFDRLKETFKISYGKAAVLAEDYLKETEPVSAMGQKRYETVDRVLCQLNMEVTRIKHLTLDEVKGLKKGKLTYDGLLLLNAEGKAVREAKVQAEKKAVPGKNEEALSIEGYIDSVQEKDAALVKADKKTTEKLMKDIEAALDKDERVVLKLKAEDSRMPSLTRFKVLGLAEKDGVSFVMLRNPWDDGRISYERQKGSGKIVSRAKEEDESGALYLKEELAGALMEIVK